MRYALAFAVGVLQWYTGVDAAPIDVSSAFEPRQLTCITTSDTPFELSGLTTSQFSSLTLSDGTLRDNKQEVASFDNGELFMNPADGSALFSVCGDELEYDGQGVFYLCPLADGNMGIFLTAIPGSACVTQPITVTFLTHHETNGEPAAHAYPVEVKINSGGHTYQGRYLLRRSVIPEAAQSALRETSLSPMSERPQYRLMAATMFKDKRRYLREWIEFHRITGVGHFLLYDNGSEDSPLDVLQPYIDEGVVTYSIWPPKSINDVYPVPAAMLPEDAKEQESFLRRSMTACLKNEWQTHKQGACQFAVSVDILRRSYGRAEWVGFFDIDEFIYPSEQVGNPNLAELFDADFPSSDYIVLCGSVFGTNGHLTAPMPRKFDIAPPLVVEEYVRRRALDDHGPSPFNEAAEEFEHRAEVGGELAQHFGMPETYARKSFVRPEKAGWSLVHDWIQLPSGGDDWTRVDVWINHPRLKMNHYAFLSVEDANRKALENGNPLSAYNQAQDAFFSKEVDTGAHWLLQNLRFHIISAVLRHNAVKDIH
jgi:hypothetical protein